MNDCVFCGQPIRPDQPTAGRPPMAAHVTCADAALADDGHWDAVAAAAPMDDEMDEPPSRGGESGRSASGAGCVVLAVGVLGALGAFGAFGAFGWIRVDSGGFGWVRVGSRHHASAPGDARQDSQLSWSMEAASEA